MAIENGTQIKVVLPEHIHHRLEQDAQQVAVPVASMVRMILAGHYQLLAGQQPVPAPQPANQPSN